MSKGLLTLLLLFTCFARAQVVDTWQFANPQQQEQALNIASQLRCPQCQNQNLLESNAPVAVSMRHQVYSMVAEGKNEVEIIGWMTERYGDFVRYNPPLTGQTLVLWALPVVLLLLMALILWRVRAKRMKQPKIPVKMLTTLTILMVFLCVGSYLLSPKWQAVRAEYQRQRDPLHQFASQQTPEAQLQALQDKIRANPQNSEQWALLGEYYLWQNDYSNSLLAYRQALQLHGENAELYAALATVLYYQASQHMTAQTRAMIDKALALDSNEITALMLLASDAFMQANYAQAIELWQKVMDLNSPRINRTQLVESINMAKLLQRRSD